MINDLFPNAPFLNSDNRKYKEKENDCVESGCGCIFLIACIKWGDEANDPEIANEIHN